MDPATRMNHHSSRHLVGVSIFAGAYVLAAIVAALSTGNREFLIYILVMIALIVAIMAVHRRVGLSAGLLWALATWGALHMAGGLVPVPASWPVDGEFRVLYSWWVVPGAGGSTAGEGVGGWLKYDQVLHAYGFGITTWMCWQALCGAVRRHAAEGRSLQPSFGLMVLVAAAGIGFGALNEVVEFIASRVTVTNVGGYVNTGLDLIYNLLGAAVAATVIRLRAYPPGRGLPPRCSLESQHDVTGPRCRPDSSPATSPQMSY